MWIEEFDAHPKKQKPSGRPDAPLGRLQARLATFCGSDRFFLPRTKKPLSEGLVCVCLLFYLSNDTATPSRVLKKKKKDAAIRPLLMPSIIAAPRFLSNVSRTYSISKRKDTGSMLPVSRVVFERKGSPYNPPPIGGPGFHGTTW